MRFLRFAIALAAARSAEPYIFRGTEDSTGNLAMDGACPSNNDSNIHGWPALRTWRIPKTASTSVKSVWQEILKQPKCRALERVAFHGPHKSGCSPLYACNASCFSAYADGPSTTVLREPCARFSSFVNHAMSLPVLPKVLTSGRDNTTMPWNQVVNMLLDLLAGFGCNDTRHAGCLVKAINAQQQAQQVFWQFETRVGMYPQVNLCLIKAAVCLVCNFE